MRKALVAALFLVTAVFSGVTIAQPAEGEHYITLPNPVTTSQPDKIEVVAMFWYGCSYCYQLEPTLNDWKKDLPEDVNFMRVPAMFGGIWDTHGQAFYTLEALNIEEKLHNELFEAVQNQGQRLGTVGEIAEFVSKRGVDKEAFTKAWDSFAVKSQVTKAKKLAISYQVNGVPTLIVNGKYRFDIASSGGLTQTTQVADFLIAQERKASTPQE